MILLQITAEDLRLPGFDSGTLVYLVYFLFFIILVLLFLQWRLKKETKAKALANRFMRSMMHVELTAPQFNAMGVYFARLSRDEKTAILNSRKHFAVSLHRYLLSATEIRPQDAIESFAKIFPDKNSLIEIKSLADLRLDEMCALDIQGKAALVSVIEVKENEAHLRLEDRNPVLDSDAVLSVYRAKLGGYFLHGKVRRSAQGNLVFTHEGPIDFRADHHFMCRQTLDLDLTPWHSLAESAASDPTVEAELTGETLHARTQLFSDRALVIHFAEEVPAWVLRRQEYWKMVLHLEGEPIESRARIIHYKEGVITLYLVRLLDLTPESREKLSAFIQKNQPEPERF